MPPAEVPGVRIERFLGSGAFGQVWVGRDMNTGRGVAVKFYLHRGGVNWSLLSREVKNLVQLSADRHVVQVLEVGWDADPPYYVMELIEGGSLEEALLRRGRLPLGEAVELFRKICIGLNRCHGKGVLHCDIKPANILLAADSEPRLADFGQSRMSHDQTPAMGTLFYMAPEQADLESTPDARWDVYAAGAILYRMLTGNAPHRDQSLLSQLDTAGSLPVRLACYREAIALAPPAMDQVSRRGLDRELRKILRRCLEIDPKKRYANVQQILDDIRRRDAIRAKRPLLLLGIVGPILLLLATCVFAARSIDKASESATRALRREASGSNRLAARFAAQTLQTEIERYFQLAEIEAGREEFLERLQNTLDQPKIEASLTEIARSSGVGDGSPDEARERLLDAPPRLDLDDYLNRRLDRYSGDTAPRRQQLATMFVTDSAGTILSIAYQERVSRERGSAGRNYAYRTYFTGRDDDLPTNTPPEAVNPLTSTHLSAAFQSTATGLWKVAISTPIFLEDPDGAKPRGEAETGTPRPAGVFVITINLGDFRLLQNEHADQNVGGASQIAVLVEAREGPLRGTVLQHPLMDRMQRQGEVLSQRRYQVADDVLGDLLAGGDVDYRDPMATVPEGRVFGGQWLAAVQPVTLPDSELDPAVADPGRPADDQESPAKSDSAAGGSPEQGLPRGEQQTDLLVLVQYRLADVLGPVEELSRSLLLEGALSVLSILLVTLFLWWVVRRVTSVSEDVDGEPDEPTGVPPEHAETMLVS